MKVKDALKALDFKEVQILRCSKREGINEYFLIKGKGKIHVLEVYLINKFVLKEEVDVLNIPFVIWLDFYRAGACLLYTSPSPRDGLLSRMPSSA